MCWFMLDLLAAFAACVSNKYGYTAVHLPTNNYINITMEAMALDVLHFQNDSSP